MIKNVVGKILPKIELLIGLGVGAVFAIPLDWDLELVFQSYVDVTSGTNQILSVSPTSMNFDRQGSLPFTITPQAGGQESVKWSFSQRISMGLDFYIKSKMIADVTGGVALSYESPWSSIKVLSTDLLTLPAKTLPNALSAELSIPLPKLGATLASINSTTEDATLKIFVNDETGANISGAKVEGRTSLKSYSASDLGDGYYSVSVPISELSSIQISATKSGYEGTSTKADIEIEHLQEYNEIASELNELKSTFEQLKADYEPLNRELGAARNLNYIFIITTIVFIATTAYFALRKPKVKTI